VTRDMPFTLSALRAAYADGTSPADVIRDVYRRIADVNDPAIFIHLRAMEEVIAEAEAQSGAGGGLPLAGVPFAVKDNIDVAGCPTTAACAAYLYWPEQDAFVVGRLRQAGAIVIGKTNLDQFATGLVGVRSPYGVPRNAVDPDIVPGGSSSGSAVAVARRLVAFSLGTDTAGSGRVPAALNDIVGLKPSLGALSATGVVPACRTLDTVSIFAPSPEDAHAVYEMAAAYDPTDAYARAMDLSPLRPPERGTAIGVPTKETREFFGDTLQSAAFDAALDRLREIGLAVVELDFSPFFAVAAMLYEGAWVAERLTVVEELMRRDPDALHPTTAGIIGAARHLTASDAFRGIYRLAELKRAVQQALGGIDLLAVPTIPTFYTCEDLRADPFGPNARLGTYTNFVNLLDFCGLAFPTAPRSDGRPGSLTLLGRSGMDGVLAGLARAYRDRTPLPVKTLPAKTLALKTGPAVPASSDSLSLAVCGAHMSGMPLNDDLRRLGARFVGATRTASHYRLFALTDFEPARPGLLRTRDGVAVEVEIWELPKAAVGGFLAGIAAPLGLGVVELEDGRSCHGFLVEAAATEGAEDISAFGGWRAYLDR